ncbi:MAG: CRISPR-associated protein Cas4 [Armatimonadota bacterium]|nr:CRISPR-associated protein Cas4 [Armatimonadota bacterium]
MELNHFTGTQVNYYAVCHRKLWLFSHDVEMERENENVQLGKLLDQESYPRQQKAIALDERVVIDWIEGRTNPDGSVTLHEVKKSRAGEAAHRLQMLYYLYYLKSKGVTAHGQIDYPLLKKTEKIELTAEAESELRVALREIERIVESEDVPPRLTNKRFCEKCAYFELCWS